MVHSWVQTRRRICNQPLLYVEGTQTSSIDLVLQHKAKHCPLVKTSSASLLLGQTTYGVYMIIYTAPISPRTSSRRDLQHSHSVVGSSIAARYSSPHWCTLGDALLSSCIWWHPILSGPAADELHPETDVDRLILGPRSHETCRRHPCTNS